MEEIKVLRTSFQIIKELSTVYNAPRNKLQSLERHQKLFKVVRGLYETEKSVSPLFLSAAIYGPSYISFETALSVWDLIPEKVTAITSATFAKNKSKCFDTQFGRFLYRDIPKSAFPYEVYIKSVGERNYLIAGKEKSICDMLYKESPIQSEKRLKEYLFENLRIEESDFYKLDFSIICDLCDLYKSSNLRVIKSYVQKNIQIKDVKNDNTCPAND